MRTLVTSILALALAASLSACERGLNTNNNLGTNAAAGSYQGTYINPRTGATDSLYALIDGDGHGVLIDQTSPMILRFRLSPDVHGNFGSPFTEYAGSGFGIESGTAATTGSIGGNVVTGSSLSGTLTFGSGGTAQPFSLTYNARDYAMSAPFSTTGVCTGSGGSTTACSYQFSYTAGSATVTATLQLNSSGAISYTDSSGCTLATATNQPATIPNASYNAYEFTLTGTCGSASVTRTGLAEYNPANGGNRPNLTLEFDDGVSFAVAGNAVQEQTGIALNGDGRKP